MIEFITGEEWKRLGSTEQELYLEKALVFWRSNGFPYPRYSQLEIEKIFSILSNSSTETIFLPNNELQANTFGVGLANSFHPHMWNVKFPRYRTALECFKDDDLLRNCIRKSLILWPKRRGASPGVLRHMLRTYQHTRRVSNFRPMVAKAIYERYSRHGALILDFCAGYGGRLLGCMPLTRHFKCIDPARQQVDGLIKMCRSIEKTGLLQAKVEIIKACAEEVLPELDEDSFDLVFSSPPYFDCEKYSNEETQSYKRYPRYNIWRDKFLFKVIKECCRILKPNGYFIINVANLDKAPIAADTEYCASKMFVFIKKYYLRMNKLPFHRTGLSTIFGYESVFVYRKEFKDVNNKSNLPIKYQHI